MWADEAGVTHLVATRLFVDFEVGKSEERSVRKVVKLKMRLRRSVGFFFLSKKRKMREDEEGREEREIFLTMRERSQE